MFQLLAITLFLSSCGYHLGSIAHPQIKTIAIAPVKNETYIPNVAENMRQSLSEAFQRDGSWKVKSMSEADCIIYARVTSIAISATDVRSGGTSTDSNTSITYMTTVFGMTITVEFTVIIPGRTKPLVSTTQVSETTQYQVPADTYTAQQNALQQACYMVALDVVSASTESW